MTNFETLEQWRKRFEEISTSEFDHPPVPSVPPPHGSVLAITSKKCNKLPSRLAESADPAGHGVNAKETKCLFI